MFTVPVGAFDTVSVTVRPTANTVSSGSVTNAANAYDTDLNSFASTSGNVDWNVNTFTAGTVTNPTVYVKYYPVMVLGGPSTASFYITLSTDSGSTYPYTIASLSGDQDPGAAITASITIPLPVNRANTRVRFVASVTGGATADIKIYDVRMTS